MADKQDNNASYDDARDAVRELLRWIGEDPDRKGLLKTPDRVLKSFGDWFGGYQQDAAEILGSSFPEAGGYSEMVALTDIDFNHSHHLVC